MNYRIWYSTESLADYIIENTLLKHRQVITKKIYESDANNAQNFHSMPDHIKKILYLDAPDLVVEADTEPIFSIEVTTEAGTGHNTFQRFARLAASVENGVPAFYVYPEAAVIRRQGGQIGWDIINPLVFKALGDIMSIYHIPALLYYFPSHYREQKEKQNLEQLPNKGLKYDKNRVHAGCPDAKDQEMKKMFEAIDEIINVIEKTGVIKGREKLLGNRVIQDRRNHLQQEYARKGGNENMSPLTATRKIPTAYLLNHLSRYEGKNYKIGELLRSRGETILYQADAKFRGDPYPGALAAIDYLLCREGKTFEERKYNLVLVWGKIEIDGDAQNIKLLSDKSSVNDFFEAVKASEGKNLLTKDFEDITHDQIPRYYMQVRYGSTFSKVKHIRVYAYFADAILFPNGALWRDA